MDDYEGIEEGQNYKTLTLDVDYYQSFLDDVWQARVLLFELVGNVGPQKPWLSE